VILASTRTELRDALDSARQRGLRIGLVPTMGYLHEGHLSLLDLARGATDFLAVSIFVNPLQFGPGEDLGRYPRDLERDLSLLGGRGADLVFHPGRREMYPWGDPVVTVDPGSLGRRLCGEFRPGHFRGVLTVVARLFGLFRPQVAVFGQKDYQQAVLVRRMVRDLELAVEVLMAPVRREGDGLAMSSRNVFLSPEERAQAVGLHRGLLSVERAFQTGERSLDVLRGVLARELEAYPLLRLQYGEIVHPDQLEPLDPVAPGAVVAAAVHCGPTRLIDNIVLPGGDHGPVA
jgi:pantoate--beta-alanine ligase